VDQARILIRTLELSFKEETSVGCLRTIGIIHVLQYIRMRGSSWWEIYKERMFESRGSSWRHFTHQAVQNGIDASRKRIRL
jgi:hypothetical protein